MSNVVFPSASPPNWSWTWPIKKSPDYKTLVQTPSNQRGETRISLTQYPIWVWDINLSYIKGDFSAAQVNSAVQQVVGFYGQMQGAASDWLYQDPYDNSCVGQILGYGDGTVTQFQTVRNTGGMVDLMQTAFPSNVYINGSVIAAGPQTSGQQWYGGLENLLLSSQALNNANWTTTSTTATNNQALGPDGTNTATNLAFGSHSGNVFAGIVQNVSVPTVLPASVTFSVWLKTATGTATAEIVANTQTDNAGGTTNAATASCAVTTSWTRFNVTLNILQQQGTAVQVQIRSPFASSQSGFSVLAWGAQLERWTAPTSYNVTTTSQVVPNGLITFVAAPAEGAVVTMDFSFYYRCRFLDDQWTDLQEWLYQIWSQTSVKFKSVLI